ncbi:MAG: hypothetical protein JW820_19990, partial [Spirochaetales bacterium]|nr:hypothetical protein [Spirochaetales bacterium]
LDDAGDLEPFVKPLALGAFVSQLDDLLPEFEDALAEKKQEETTYDEVEAADARAQERLLQLVAKILGEYNLDTADHIRTRSLLMDHIVDQNTRIGQNHRRRRFRDVNPDTGEEVEPAAPAAAPAAPSTPANPKPA